MPYIIKNSDQTITVTVEDNKVDSTNYSLALVGRQVSNYGQYFAQNTLRHLENFASSTPPTPAVKLTGQLWYDKTEGLFKVYDGSVWKRSTGILVNSEPNRPTTDLRAGTAFFNTSKNILEIYNGNQFLPASYGGEITNTFSNDMSNSNATFFGTRLRTLFLKEDGLDTVHPVLALVYVKSTIDTDTGANRGTTQIGEQYETIMALISDSQFQIAADTQTPVDGLTINYNPELTQVGVGIASARTGRAQGLIKKGINLRQEYEIDAVTSFDTLYANQIGDSANEVTTIYANSIVGLSSLTIEDITVNDDLVVGGDLDLTGDLTSSGGTLNITSAELTTDVLTVNNTSTLNGDTTINGNLVVNGLGAEDLGDLTNKIDNIYVNNIFADNGNIATANITSALRSLGDVTFDQDLSVVGTSNLGITNVDGALGVTGVSTFDSSLIMSASGAPSATFNEINVRANQDINLSGTGRLVGPATQVSITSDTTSSDAQYVLFSGATGSASDLKGGGTNNFNLKYIPSEDRLYVNKLRVGGTSPEMEFISASGSLTFGPGTIVGTGVFTSAGFSTASGDASIGGTVSFGSLRDTGESITITKFVDEADGIASNNTDTTIPTSAAIKDYVDTANTNLKAYVDGLDRDDDLSIAGDTGTGLIDLDSQSLTVSGGTNLTSSASGQTITVNLDSTITGLTQVTATNISATGNFTGDLIGTADNSDNAAAVTLANTTATTNYIVMSQSGTGTDRPLYTDETEIGYNAVTHTLTTTNYIGDTFTANNFFDGDIRGDVLQDDGTKILENSTGALTGTVSSITNHESYIRGRVSGGTGITYDNSTGVISLSDTGLISGVAAGTGLSGGGTSGNVTLSLAAAGAGAGTYGSTADSTKIDEITLDAYGRVTAVSTGPSGDIKGVTAGDYLTGGGTSGTVTLDVDATSANTASKVVARDASGNFSAGVITATATSARYADLAEIYKADADYEPGTVVKLGGSEEITMTVEHADTEVFGVISTDPAYLMNKDAEGLPVALTGRVPVKVIGKIRKGERLVSSDVPGRAWALGDEEYDARAVIGRSLEDKDNGNEGVIEAVIGVK